MLLSVSRGDAEAAGGCCTVVGEKGKRDEESELVEDGGTEKALEEEREGGEDEQGMSLSRNEFSRERGEDDDPFGKPGQAGVYSATEEEDSLS